MDNKNAVNILINIISKINFEQLQRHGKTKKPITLQQLLSPEILKLIRQNQGSGQTDNKTDTFSLSENQIKDFIAKLFAQKFAQKDKLRIDKEIEQILKSLSENPNGLIFKFVTKDGIFNINVKKIDNPLNKIAQNSPSSKITFEHGSKTPNYKVVITFDNLSKNGQGSSDSTKIKNSLQQLLTPEILKLIQQNQGSGQTDNKTNTFSLPENQIKDFIAKLFAQKDKLQIDNTTSGKNDTKLDSVDKEITQILKSLSKNPNGLIFKFVTEDGVFNINVKKIDNPLNKITQNSPSNKITFEHSSKEPNYKVIITFDNLSENGQGISEQIKHDIFIPFATSKGSSTHIQNNNLNFLTKELGSPIKEFELLKYTIVPNNKPQDGSVQNNENSTGIFVLNSNDNITDQINNLETKGNEHLSGVVNKITKNIDFIVNNKLPHQFGKVNISHIKQLVKEAKIEIDNIELKLPSKSEAQNKISQNKIGISKSDENKFQLFNFDKTPDKLAELLKLSNKMENASIKQPDLFTVKKDGKQISSKQGVQTSGPPENTKAFFQKNNLKVLIKEQILNNITSPNEAEKNSTETKKHKLNDNHLQKAKSQNENNSLNSKTLDANNKASTNQIEVSENLKQKPAHSELNNNTENNNTSQSTKAAGEGKSAQTNNNINNSSNQSSNKNDKDTKKHSDNALNFVKELANKSKISDKGKLAFETPKQNNERLIKTTEILKEITNFVHKRDKSTITFKLNPEHLGKIKVMLDIVDKIVNARIEVQNEAVKQMIESNLASLQNQILQSGVQLNSLNISLSNNNRKQTKSDSSKRKNRYAEKLEGQETEPTSNKKKMMGYNTLDYIA